MISRCPLEPSVFPALNVGSKSGKSLLAPFQAFKFASDSAMKFQLTISFCIDSCPKVSSPPPPSSLKSNSFLLLLSIFLSFFLSLVYTCFFLLFKHYHLDHTIQISVNVHVHVFVLGLILHHTHTLNQIKIQLVCCASQIG